MLAPEEDDALVSEIAETSAIRELRPLPKPLLLLVFLTISLTQIYIRYPYYFLKTL